ncbi:MAG: phosphoglyceromutase [Alphaproteobacteria bacterium]|nr:MAG: phosphoglyceromutase [Alphaproteobacteria bacterium]
MIGLGAPAQATETKTDTVVLVTIDGLRWQEIFRGVDPAFFDQEQYMAYKKHHADFKAAYGQADVAARRQALMPFFWGTLARDGQLYGNRDRGSEGRLVNPYHFSYPGYSEILTGVADPRINSNDMVQNPNHTMLEWLIGKPENKGRVAAFGSWDVFPYIINRDRSGVPVNAGFEAYDARGEADIEQLNKLQDMIPSPWDTVRLDAFTMGFARAALRRDKMRFVYIALGETDDFAHEGFYDQYANAAHRADRMIGDLWTWLQSDPRYKGRTTLIVTCDHGRGSDSLEAWKYHGRFPYKKEDGSDAISDFKGDDQIWIAAIGPDTLALGEVAGGAPVALNQIATTATKLLGYEGFDAGNDSLKPGAPILRMLPKAD